MRKKKAKKKNKNDKQIRTYDRRTAIRALRIVVASQSGKTHVPNRKQVRGLIITLPLYH
jgi:hypothetical protein